MDLINNNRTKIVAAMFVIVAVLVISISALGAAGELMKWKKLDTMDTSFTVIENKAGDQDILLELDMEDSGTYNLQYYLEDNRQVEIVFVQSFDQLDIEYYVYENDGAGVITNITQDLLTLSYLEMDYDLTVPNWSYDGSKTVGVSGGLEFSIPRSASAIYPGVSFEINNKRVLINWDFQQDVTNILIDDYENGKIMPVQYVTPNKGTENFNVLKQLEDFDIKPTHLKPDGGTNVELSPVVLPNLLGDVPGNRPGLEITFKQPKSWDPVSWGYVYTTNLDDITAIFELENIGSGDYLDFTFDLKDEANQSISSLPAGDAAVNAGVTYTYGVDNANEYKINIVQDKSDLNNQLTTIQWSDLLASSIYNANINFQVDLASSTFDDYEFTSYAPEDNFAYTFMEYELKRSNAEEAYLDIQPYNSGDQSEIEYVILYSKTIKDTLDPDEDLWLKNYHTSEDGNDEIFIPVPFRSTSSQDAYQVVVNFAGTEIYSQVLNYEAVNDSNVPPTTPGIELIDNLFVVPPQDATEDDPRKVMFDLVWDAPTNKTITELDSIFESEDPDSINNKLYYELSVNDVPTDEDSNPFQVLKIFEVYKEGGEYKLRAHADSPNLVDATHGTDSSIPSEVVGFDVGYNETDEQLRMEKIVLYDDVLYADGWATVLDTTIDEIADTYDVVDSGTAYDFEFPGVNYIRLKAITISDGVLTTSDLSVPASVALSLITYDIPIVDTLDYSPLYGVEEDRTSGVTLEWHTVESENYENNMLAPIDYSLVNVTYRVYIAEDKSTLIPLGEDADYRSIPMDGASLVIVDGDELSDTVAGTGLRDGSGLYFDLPTSKDLNTDLSVDIQGLDVNRNYYIRIVTLLEVEDKDSAPVESRVSDPSSVLGVTVPKIPAEPGDSEVFPLAPESMMVDFSDESQISAGISWHMPEEMTFDDDEYGFEIVSLEDRSLPTDLSSKDTGIESILGSSDLENDVVEGWRLVVEGGTTYFRKYNRETGLWEDLDLSLVEIEDNEFYVIDNENSPNKVNYYYVRSINVSGTEVVSASPWAIDTLTTAPVQGPVNLIVDYDTDYTYEAKEEFIIRFDAPIPDVADVGSDYLIEVHVKGEDDTDYSVKTYPATLLGSGSDGPVGYERLYYRVSNLKPGKTYSIKIRIEDRTKPQEELPDGSLAYPKSPYSDRVVSRTEFDQESYDKENKYYEYLEYYQDRAEALKELLYFEITESTDEYALKYRENYSEGVIKRLSNSEWVLATKNKPINTYYIPAASLESVNDYEVTIVLESQDQTVGIRPNTVGIRLTDEVDDLLEDIAMYASAYEDYYLRIRLFTDAYNGQINGNDPTSDLVQLEFGLVESQKLEETMDDLMVASLDNVIEANKSELISKIEEELEKGIHDDLLLNIVEEMVEEVRNEYMVNAAIVFNGYVNKDVTIVQEINKAVYLALEPEISPANNAVYSKLNGVWKKVTSSYFNNKYYVDTSLLNPYILIPSVAADSDLIERYSQQGVDVINTYSLSSIFSSYQLKLEEEPIDKYQWISALARLAGATAGSDTPDYLDSKGIEVSSVNSFAPVTYEEALDAYVKTYAYRHQIDLNRVYISNYNLVEDMTEVTETYSDSIVAGANLGIIPVDSGPIEPKHELTMKETIDLLTTLHFGLD